MNKFWPGTKLRIFFFLILLSMFFVMLLINNNTPLWSDDWAFHVAYGEKRVQTVTDVFSSVGTFYYSVNGRSVANFIVVLFAALGKSVFNIFNALMLILLGVAIYYFANDDRKLKPIGLVGVFALLWFCVPAPAQTLFWQCGAVVYMWMTVLGLLFLLPYKKLLIEKKDIFTGNYAVGLVVMFVFGLLTGNSNELLAPVVFLSTLLTVFVLWKQKLQVPRWCYAGSLGVFVGLMVQLTAPGNFVKLNSGAQNGNFGEAMAGRFEKIIPGMIEHQGLLWIIVGLILCIYLANKLYFKKGMWVMDQAMLVFLVGAIGLDLMRIIFPYFPPRAYFFSSIFMIIFVSRFLLDANFLKIKNILVLLVVPFFVFSIWAAIVQSGILNAEYEKREASIFEQKARGGRDITVKKIKKIDNEKLLNDTLGRGNHFGASLFYGVDSIKISR